MPTRAKVQLANQMSATTGHAAVYHDSKVIWYSQPLTPGEANTLRQHYAGLALQGLTAQPGRSTDATACAKRCVELADALIAELSK